MKFGKTFNELCTPAMVYFVISAVAILFALFSGIALAAVAMKAFFVVFWTYLLNLLCKKGFKSVSWFLVLLPYLMILGSFIMTSMAHREGFDMANYLKKEAPNIKKQQQVADYKRKMANAK